MAATRAITFTLNGAPVVAEVKPHHNLVEMLQTQFGLTGARESCGQGLCGCCTVIVDGRSAERLRTAERLRRSRHGVQRPVGDLQGKNLVGDVSGSRTR